MVVVRRGCGKIGESASITCGCESRLRWCIISIKGLRDFLNIVGESKY